MQSGSTLVTGAAGFAGAHLLEHLARTAPNQPLRGWARTISRAATAHGNISWCGVDMLDPGVVSRAIAANPPSEVYHLAGASHTGASWQRPAAYLEIHVSGTHHLLEAVRQHAPACRVLVVSSGMIYRPQDYPVTEDAPFGPVSPYALSKLAEDQLAIYSAQHDDLDIVVARPFNHIGPGQALTFAASSFARQIAEIECGAKPASIAVGNLEAARDLTDVRDVVTAYATLMRVGRRGAAYNVCRGQAVQMSALLDQMLALSNSRVHIEQDPDRLRPNDIPFLAGDPKRLHTETGWSPKIPLTQTLTDLLNYWRTSLATTR